METISRSLLTFLLNSLWQIPLAAAVAALACRFMRNGPASHRHAVWVAALAAAVLLPLASVAHALRRTPAPQFAASLADAAASNSAAAQRHARPPHTPAPAPPSRTISFAATTATILLGGYFLFVLLRVGRLAWASIRTVRIRRRRNATAFRTALERVWTRCQEAFGADRRGTAVFRAGIRARSRRAAPSSFRNRCWPSPRRTCSPPRSVTKWRTSRGAISPATSSTNCSPADRLSSGRLADSARDRAHPRNGVR